MVGDGSGIKLKSMPSKYCIGILVKNYLKGLAPKHKKNYICVASDGNNNERQQKIC